MYSHHYRCRADPPGQEINLMVTISPRSCFRWTYWAGAERTMPMALMVRGGPRASSGKAFYRTFPCPWHLLQTPVW